MCVTFVHSDVSTVNSVTPSDAVPLRSVDDAALVGEVAPATLRVVAGHRPVGVRVHSGQLFKHLLEEDVCECMWECVVCLGDCMCM